MLKGRYLTTIIAGCLLAFTLGLGTTCLGFFVGPVVADLGFSVTEFAAHISVLVFASIFGYVIAPILAKKIGVRGLIILDGIISGGAIILFSRCNSIMAFYVLSVIIGLIFFQGNSYVIPIFISKWFAKSLGSILGVCFAFSGVCGTVMGLFLPGVIASAGWRTGYVVLGAVTMVLFLICGIFLIKESPDAVGMKPYGYEEVQASSADKTAAASANKTAVDNSFTLADCLKKWQFWVFLVCVIVLNGMSAFSSHYSNHYTTQGLDAASAGYLVSLLSAVMIFTKIAEGSVSDKIGPVKTMAACIILWAVGFLISTGATFQILAVGSVFVAVGAASITVLIPLLTRTAVGNTYYASIWGVISILNSVGSVIGNTIYSSVVDATGSYVPLLRGEVAVCAVVAILVVLVVNGLNKSRTAM